MRKKSEAQKPEVKRPEVPTKNGHYMGKNYGFNYEDGKYQVAPCIYKHMEDVLDEEKKLNEWLHANNNFAVQQFANLAKQKDSFWKGVQEEYGLDFSKQNYAYNHNGWLVPIPKEKTNTRCVYCLLVGFGDDAEIKKHHLVCEKTPWFKKV